MTSLDLFLTIFLLITVPAAWVSTGILTVLAAMRPRINVLTERAAIGFLIACFLTSSAAIRLNTVADNAFFPVEIARLVFLVSALGIGSVPVAWLVMFVTGHLGENK